MNRTVICIARYTFLEALRNRFVLIFFIALIISFAMAEFLSVLAITESKETVTSVIAFIMRLFTIIALSLFVISNVAREFNDRILWHIFSLPSKRYVYYYGKLLAYSALSLLTVLAVSILLMLYAPIIDILAWAVSMFLELLIILAFSLLSLFTFRQITFSFLSVLGFYLLARNITTFQVISESPIVQSGSTAQAFINVFLDGLAYLLPNLDQFAQSSWLLYANFQPTDLLNNLIQAAIYIILLSLAAMFDLYRLEL